MIRCRGNQRRDPGICGKVYLSTGHCRIFTCSETGYLDVELQNSTAHLRFLTYSSSKCVIHVDLKCVPDLFKSVTC